MALVRRVVRRIVIGLGGAASLAAVAVMKIYEQQAYAAYELLSGKKAKKK